MKSVLRSFLRCKSIEVLQQELTGEGTDKVKLHRALGPTNLVLFGIGVIIGAGIFSVTGSAAGSYAGPAIVLSFVIAGIGCALAGLCYSEFASMVPAAGSAYTYSYLTLGEFFAWIIGWDLVLEYAVGAATVASAWSVYLIKFLGHIGIAFPAQLAASPFTLLTLQDGSKVHGLINLPAIFIVVLMSGLLIKGIRESAVFNAIMVAVKVTVVVAFIAVGWSFINPSNHVPFIPPNEGQFGHFGWSGVLRGAAIVFFAYIGFDAVSTAAQEARNPRRDMPIGILVSLLVCTVLYCLFSYVLTGMVSYKQFIGLEGLAPVTVAIEQTPYKVFTLLVEVAILAGFSSVIMILLLGQSRVFYSMSRDGLLPGLFSDIHPRFRTPWKSNILFALFVSVFAGFVPGDVVGHMCSIGTLLAFVMVCLAVIVLRVTKPDAPRQFRVPWVPVVPILGALMCLAMMLALPMDTWIRLAVWLVLGLVIYFFYGRKRSKLHRAAQ
ncbi:MAG: amino acid transporter [Verrucomicrobia bacterium 61-8]|nr:amino acid permease [Verrucomicrobiota bacterium]OJV06331.1 MAG: amino acid transporter [Verrucomicrobia bacterium 61-8]